MKREGFFHLGKKVHRNGGREGKKRKFRSKAVGRRHSILGREKLYIRDEEYFRHTPSRVHTPSDSSTVLTFCIHTNLISAVIIVFIVYGLKGARWRKTINDDIFRSAERRT